MKINSNYKLREVAGGSDYSVSKTMGGTTIYLMQGTVNVIKATLDNE